MAVSPVSRTHLTQQEKLSAPATNRAQNGASKSATTTAASPQAQAKHAQETQAAANAENHAGQEQGKHHQQSEAETKGTRVNVYA